MHMLIRWLNDDQRLEQAEPRWSPRGKRCSPSSWESVQTRSKQIVRKINIWGWGRSLVWRSKEAGVRSAWKGVWKPGALLGQFKRSDVFTDKLCPGIKEVQAEVTTALVSLVKVKKTPRGEKKQHQFWFRLKHLRIWFTGSATSVSLDELSISSFGFQKEKGFSF